jgi:hypothetical protein
MHFLLFYELTPQHLQHRDQFRAEHLRLAWEFQQRGELILAGAYADPTDGAALLFKGDSRAVPERFVAADPYVTSGPVKNWRIREWTTVVGQDATTPVRGHH